MKKKTIVLLFIPLFATSLITIIVTGLLKIKRKREKTNLSIPFESHGKIFGH
jgi:hypothetical protein